jgi:hypothetical protein
MGDFNLYMLDREQKERMSKLSELFKTEKIGGVTVNKPPHMSQRVLAMLLLPVLIYANKWLDLGFSSAELTMVAGAVASFIIGKSWEDAAKRAAAIAKG